MSWSSRIGYGPSPSLQEAAVPTKRRKPRITTGEDWRRSQSEAAFQKTVTDLASYCGWDPIYHTKFSAWSNRGFPDLVMVHQKRQQILFVELKKEKGHGASLTPYQTAWLLALETVQKRFRKPPKQRIGGKSADLYRPPFQVYLWRPTDWPKIQAVLTGDKPLGVEPPGKE
jgi:hypothetical protein